jgi:hypothetical protein
MREALSTDPRDKLYAALGLCEAHARQAGDRAERRLLLVDYESSIQDVYSNLVRFIVLSTKRLSVSFHCLERSEYVQRSWTPD